MLSHCACPAPTGTGQVRGADRGARCYRPHGLPAGAAQLQPGGYRGKIALTCKTTDIRLDIEYGLPGGVRCCDACCGYCCSCQPRHASRPARQYDHCTCRRLSRSAMRRCSWRWRSSASSARRWKRACSRRRCIVLHWSIDVTRQVLKRVNSHQDGLWNSHSRGRHDRQAPAETRMLDLTPDTALGRRRCCGPATRRRRRR